ncbi:MAG: hypothetical protein HFE50_07110, partial [Clostridia bacterium]|nr:hypothetical protein [Clostridia bacterium]
KDTVYNIVSAEGDDIEVEYGTLLSNIEFPDAVEAVVENSADATDRTNAVEDKDMLDVGLCGGSVVFLKSDMLFSTRIISEPFMNIDMLLKPADKKLVAKIKSADMQTMIETVSMIASVSEDTAPVALKFKENGVQLSIESTEASSTLDVPAQITDGVGREFYYNAKYFTDMLKVIRGDVNVSMTNGGVLYVSNNKSEYMLMNVRNREVKRKTKKAAPKAKEKQAA